MSFKTELDYTSGSSIIPDDAFGISPSQLHKFFDKPHEWYRTEILKETGFTGNTASVLGTIVHFVAKEYTQRKEVNKKEIYKYLFKTCITNYTEYLEEFNQLISKELNEDELNEFLFSLAANPDFNIKEILSAYKEMGNNIIRYIGNKINHSEELISTKIKDNIYVCGSCDAGIETEAFVENHKEIRPLTIIDYKTTSTINPKSYIPFNYKLQLLSYAYIYTKLGYNIDYISIVWVTKPIRNRISEKTGKALKEYPSKVIEVKEPFTSEDYKYIESILNLVADTVLLTKEHPELTYIIWRDSRLK